MQNFSETLKQFFKALREKIAALFGKKPPEPIIVQEPEPEEDGTRYVVVDLEWNQYPKWVRTPTSKDGVVMPHEIIQIGAVKVDAAFNVVDTFVAGIRLQGRRKLSKHVARVIHKTQEEIDQGDDFPVAYARFSDWSADAERFITWGTDDIRVFQNNLAYYKMETLDATCWYDAQMVYARQIRGDHIQTSLAKAAETLGVQEDEEEDGAYHDALYDAYITVNVCSRLDMDTGMEELSKPRPQPKPKVNENRLFMQKKFVSASSESGFETRALAKQHCGAMPVCCPTCGTAMKQDSGRVTSGDRWMKMAICKEHGKHLVRYRVRRKADDEFVWSRTVYAPDAELEDYFTEKLAAAKRRHSRPPKKPAARKQEAPVASGQM